MQTITLTEEQQRIIADRIASGRYPDIAGVLTAGLRTLELEEREYERKLAALRALIDEADASEDVEGDVFAEVFERIRLRSAEQNGSF